MPEAETPLGTEPPADCRRCPRLADFRHQNRTKFPAWHNAPVPAFGNQTAGLVIVGLAPGLQGANRTGRPFTGDYAGDLLFATLIKHGLASGTYDRRPDDGLTLGGALIVNAVRCVPPQNKPVGAEIAACRPYLTNSLAQLPNIRAYLALGRIAHESLLKSLGKRQADFKFRHGAAHELGGQIRLFDSYHCSRYNTNTGRLTVEMFEQVVFDAAAWTAG